MAIESNIELIFETTDQDHLFAVPNAKRVPAVGEKVKVESTILVVEEVETTIFVEYDKVRGRLGKELYTVTVRVSGGDTLY